MPFGDRGGDATGRAIGGGHRRRARFAVLAIVVGLVLGASSLLAWYIDAQWFGSLGYSDVFWTTLQLKSTLFSGFTLVTFLLVYAALRLLKPPQLNAPHRPRALRQRTARPAVARPRHPARHLGGGAGRRRSAPAPA